VGGGVVRLAEAEPGQVAVIVGGGSGHYPAFAGLIGMGLAHGAAVGNIFASPSAHHIYSVAMAAQSGGGVLLSYGNYAGDVLNFDAAQERLISEGIPCRTVVVTDDISSAPSAEKAKRRGIAGGLAVFKAAGFAAMDGKSLDEVWELAHRANNRTRSFGVALSGCTLPGAEDELFSVPRGRIAMGMGIHGEPGIGEGDLPSADDLAELLVSQLLAELPHEVESVEGARIAVILNGLGSVKYEELFVLYGRIAQILKKAGAIVVEPEVGELVTSFQMAGASLTFVWLDPDLENAWCAPVDTPAWRKRHTIHGAIRPEAIPGLSENDEIGPTTEASLQTAAIVLSILKAVKRNIELNVTELGRLDSIAGDGDHGIGMQRGTAAAYRKASEAFGAGAGTVLKLAGRAWSERAGGASGALWGIILEVLGSHVGDTSVPTARVLARAAAEAAAEVVRFGKAELGDKTMVDVLLPFADALSAAEESTTSIREAWARASLIADSAADQTAHMTPKIGRARAHGEKSAGSPDPGAVSAALIIRSVREVLTEENLPS